MKIQEIRVFIPADHKWPKTAYNRQETALEHISREWASLLIPLSLSPVPLNIIQVYVPTPDSTHVEIQLFYDDLTKACKKLLRNGMTILMRDFNAKIGRSRMGENIDQGDRKERGDQLADFATEKSF